MKNFYKKTFEISSFENLVVSVFVIGYKNIGESILVLFRDTSNDMVIMSVLIDSYERDGLNIIKDVLSKYHVDKLDFVCWTHPHCDHSPGIDSIIKEMFHDNIVIFSPKFYYGNLTEDLLASESAKTPEIFENIWNLIKNHPNIADIWRTISAHGDMTHSYPIQLLAKDGVYHKDIYLYFLTPLSHKIDRFATQGNQFRTPNELSVSFIMSVDGYDFFFGGDIENGHANGICDDIVSEMRWIKVPHHCSIGARSIAERLGPRFDYAASTVFKSANLPKKEIQDTYAEAGTLHMTQLDENGDYKPSHDYGIIQYDYHFSPYETKVDIITYGNAGQYFMKT